MLYIFFQLHVFILIIKHLVMLQEDAMWDEKKKKYGVN